jgi:hypothetical protein
MDKRERVEEIRNYLINAHGLAPVLDALVVASGQQKHFVRTTHNVIVEAFRDYELPLSVSSEGEISFPDEETRQLVVEIFGQRSIH